MGALEDRLAADTAIRRKIEDYLTEHADEHPSTRQVAVHFRVSERYVGEITTLMAQHGPLPRHGRETPEVVTQPAEVLDLLVFVLAAAGPDYRSCLERCRRCRNHLLYLLDTAPYTDSPGEQIRVRVTALPEVHKAHGPDGPDQDRPRIRWITP